MDRSYRPDVSKIPALAQVLVDHDVAVMPDLSFTFTNLLMWDSLDNLWMDAELKYQHPDTVFAWRSSNINRRKEIENLAHKLKVPVEALQDVPTSSPTVGQVEEESPE